jgi:arabinofuranosyltransferase
VSAPAAAHRLADFCERRFGLLRALLLVGLVALAWHNRFLQDDAFIVFRYADHFAHGQGLVYNYGERVEGYSCFLYTVLVALGMRLGLGPVPVAHSIGLAAFAGSLLVTLRLATRLSGSRRLGLGAMALLGLNYTFSAFATGGLETQLNALLALGFLGLGADLLMGAAPNAKRLAACSLLGALAVLTRPDAVVLILPMGLVLLGDARVRPSRAAPGAGRALALLLPGAVVLGAWLVWKHGYYGALLPNTFYAKVAAPPMFTRGAYYAYRFVTSYWLEAPLLFAALRWRDVLARGGRAAAVLAATLALWTAYVVAVGGDFMEFRFFVAGIPILAWLLAETVVVLQRQAGLGAALAGLIVVGSLQHALVYNRMTHTDWIESVRRLESHLVSEDQNWIGIGKTLREAFGADSDLVIATTAAGAIPYYSRARTVDMLGLTDPWIARHGALRYSRPGHVRIATLDDLIARRVNLLIGHPHMLWGETDGPLDVRDFAMPPYDAGEGEGRLFPPGLVAVEIPIDHGYRLVALYLTRTPAIDRVIAARGWKVRALVDSQHPEARRGP